MANPAYGAMPMVQRPGSAGSGRFIPPPPGASQGGEPGPYPPFPQQYPNPSSYNWPNPNAFQQPPQYPQYSAWAASSAHSTQSQSQPPRAPQQIQSRYSQSQYPQHSQLQPRYPQQSQPQPQYSQQSQPQPQYPQQSQLQPQWNQHPHQQQSSSTPSWTYGQYPPSPDVPLNPPTASSGFPHTPLTPNAPSRYSPYSAPYQQPPFTAPAQFPSWTQFSHHQRPQEEPQQPFVPDIDEAFEQQLPRPWGGSANAPPPKKSALRKRSNSQSAADGPSRSYAPQMQLQRSGSSGSGFGPAAQASTQMHRSGSTGSGFGPTASGWPTLAPVIPTLPPASAAPAYAQGDDQVYDSVNLSARPRDWRADYLPKGRFSSYLPKIGRVRSDVEEYTDTVKRSMHPLLQQTPESSPLALDLRNKIMDNGTILPHNFGRIYTELDFAQLAAYPPAPMLRLYHTKLPWYVDVHQSHASGVTVFDVLVQLSMQMQTPIHSRHYYNETLDAADRAGLGVRYKERIAGKSGEGKRGILQVDFLGEKFVMEGLVRGKQGLWEIKTRRLER